MAKRKAKTSKKPAKKKRVSSRLKVKKKSHRSKSNANRKPKRHPSKASHRAKGRGRQRKLSTSTRSSKPVTPSRRNKLKTASKSKAGKRKSLPARKARKLSGAKREIAKLRQLVRQQAVIIRSLQPRVTKQKIKEQTAPKGSKKLRDKKGRVIGFELPPYIGKTFAQTKFGKDIWRSILLEVGEETEDFYGQAETEIESELEKEYFDGEIVNEEE